MHRGFQAFVLDTDHLTTTFSVFDTTQYCRTTLLHDTTPPTCSTGQNYVQVDNGVIPPKTKLSLCTP